MHQRGPVAFGMLLVAMLLICSPSPELQAEEADSATSSEASAPCKGLKPYNNLDELLYQFYINLDSDCLFSLPVAELEKIWDNKILSSERAESKQYSKLRMSSEFEYKPYESEKDAFYVEIIQGRVAPRNGFYPHTFEIKITKEYLEKYGSLFPDRNYPRLLPKPSIDSSPMYGMGFLLDEPRPRQRKPGDIQPGKRYYWLHSAEPAHIIDILSWDGRIREITIW